MRIVVKLPGLASSLRAAIPSADQRAQFLLDLANSGEVRWKQLGQERLRATSRDYVNGIQSIKKERSIEIELTGVVPNMVENGWPGGDMRGWMLRSPKAKTSRSGGKYLVVPFRHGTPGTSGRNVGRQMPAAIHRVARRLEPTLTSPYSGKTQWGGRLVERARMNKEARDILRTKEKPWHTASIYQGMVRQQKTYERATQSQYTTFRTISSTRRDPRSWLHPGIVPRRFAEQVQTHMGEVAKALVTRLTKRRGTR